MTTERLKPRQRPPRRNRFKPAASAGPGGLRPALDRAARLIGLVMLIMGLAVTFVLIHDLATQCRTFAARGIQVVGNRRLDERTVMRQAGVHPGINLLAVRLGACRARLMAHPWIAAATVRRRLPDRLEIRIDERQPLALAEMPDGRLLIDTAGKPFKRWAAGDPERLPIISGLGYADLPDAQNPAPPDYAAALEIVRRWQGFDGHGADAAPFTVVVDRDTGLSIDAGPRLGRVILGYDHYREKISNLHRLLRAVEPRVAAGWQRIDLTHLQRIVVRPHGGSKET